jgi:malonate-semialdehyde dehydrogenase (acetylating) / methylmalonate-semialdehyde dehydrogenase
MRKISHFIDGKIYTNSKLETSPVFNPATGEQIAEVELADIETTKLAINSSVKAQVTWSKTTPIARSRILSKYKDLLIKNHENLAKAVSQEHGKTIPDAKGSVQRGIEVVEFAIGIPELLKGDHSANVGTNVDSFNMRQPIGVCAGITPFNFPAMVPMWMYPVAIACGNTFVLKPSEKDPTCPIMLAELAIEAGFPKGVLNVVNGNKVSVDALLEDQNVKAISFVGSSPVAEYIYHTGTKNNKRVQALGGAKNHMIVMPDADIAKTTDAIIGSAFGSAGERCMAISVAVCVGKETSEKLKENLLKETAKLKVGPYTDENSDYGPLNTKAHYEKVLNYISIGEKEGAKLIMDGRKIKLQGYENGYFLGPCIFDDVKPNMAIYKEEIFGPVLSIVNVEKYNEALKLVDDHELGNGAAIFTKSGNIAKHFTENAQAGMVGVNVPIPVPVAYHSFGGWKKSLYGDHAMHGPEGVRFYTKLKTATITWVEDNAGPEFTLPVLS